MTPARAATDDADFRAAVQGLRNGDFSRLEPLFVDAPNSADARSRIVRWHGEGRFRDEPEALAEALTCACFLGHISVVEYLLDQGVDLAAGMGTGLNAFHWAANRGQLAVVRLLLGRGAAMETRNMYGGTVLGTAVWSAVHEPRPDHARIIETLLLAGARVEAAEYPTGLAEIDGLLRRHGVSA